MPFPAASRLNSDSQAEKPLPSLPHCAAEASAGRTTVEIRAARPAAALFTLCMDYPVDCPNVLPSKFPLRYPLVAGTMVSRESIARRRTANPACRRNEAGGA
jgi:hypothetical protein